MKTMQQQFEKYCNSKGISTKMRNDQMSTDLYFSYETQQKWEVWKASRHGFVVKLPFEFGDGMYKAAELRKCLLAAGVSYE